MKTQVVFRKFKDSGEVVALFPLEVANENGDCASYMHVGQHSAADFNTVLKTTVAAKPEEYQALKAELEGLEYDLDVRKRRSWPKDEAVAQENDDSHVTA